MKNLDFKNAISLTLISFIAITKQWNVLPVDAPESEMYGFPFPYSCTGWHTSMSRQFFILEFFIDILCYYIFWLVILLCLKKLHVKLFANKMIKYSLITLSGILVLISLLLVFVFENVFDLYRDFDFTVLETNIKFF
ncbi:hypothetical protein ABGT15_13060 [Flavobacterium enshiense]|uniref:hypothetical protein n=1 Tax=Flavobacterium enshiense TaxID=1341165 RepID=UPI00345D96A9